MGLFKAKKKDIEFFETETSLPPFRIDTNGFIMFDDPELGGAAVLEVFPHIRSEGITRIDPVDFSLDMDAPDGMYDPDEKTFENSREKVYPGWVFFLRSLFPRSSGDEPTHIQILCKKCRTQEWDTGSDYGLYSETKEISPIIEKARTRDATRKDVLIAERAVQYLNLLARNKQTTDKRRRGTVDSGTLPSFKMRYFLVVSYTPSSEGWWMDGRDSDYYISDNSASIADAIFADNQDKMVDRVSEMINNRRTRKNRKAGITEDGEQEDYFFWLESDRTAQILETRVNKIRRAIKDWNTKNPECEMPFHFGKLDGREVAALIRFFPNILTPYWDKIWELHSNQDDILYRLSVQQALALGNSEFTEQRELSQKIALGEVDMKYSKELQESFLDRFRGIDYEDIDTIQDEREMLSWSPEKEEARREWEEERQSIIDNSDEIWGEFDDAYSLPDEFKTEQQKQEEFLARYRNRNNVIQSRDDNDDIGLDLFDDYE